MPARSYELCFGIKLFTFSFPFLRDDAEVVREGAQSFGARDLRARQLPWLRARVAYERRAAPLAVVRYLRVVRGLCRQQAQPFHRLEPPATDSVQRSL